MERKTPLRKCTGCETMREKKQLIRVVKTNADEISIDPTGKKNGRGAYLCRDLDCLNKAYKRKALERSLKCKISEDIYHTLREQLAAVHYGDDGYA